MDTSRIFRKPLLYSTRDIMTKLIINDGIFYLKKLLYFKYFENAYPMSRLFHSLKVHDEIISRWEAAIWTMLTLMSNFSRLCDVGVIDVKWMSECDMIKFIDFTFLMFNYHL